MAQKLNGNGAGLPVPIVRTVNGNFFDAYCMHLSITHVGGEGLVHMYVRRRE